MEGVSHEACSLAGTLKLGKLICFYDDNGISIDGEVHGWFTDDTPERFEAYGWQVIRAVDGHDAEAIKRAIEAAKAETARPTLICCKTIIGWGAPNKQGTEATHGAALGDAEVAATRKALDWPYEPFVIPDEIRAGWDATGRGRQGREELDGPPGGLRARRIRSSRPNSSAACRASCPPTGASRSTTSSARRVEKPAAVATRSSSQQVLNVLARRCRSCSAARPTSPVRTTRTTRARRRSPRDDIDGNYLHYGVREFGMTAIMNGIALHGGFMPYGGTFLVFSDYARNARAHGGADEAARRARLHARLDRPRRGRPDAPAGGARRQPAHDPEHAAVAAVRYGRDRDRLGGRGRASRTGRRAWC